MKKTLMLLCLLFNSILREARSLETLDSLILGDNGKENERSGHSDPLSYVFNRSKMKGDEKSQDKYKQHLMEYLGFYREGENLDNLCDQNIPISYESFENREQVLKSMVSTFQYIGLDLTSRAIPEYARYFEFSEEEFKNLVRRIIGNYCSENMTVISLRQLAKNLLSNFNSTEKEFSLPEFSHNPLFPPEMDAKGDPKQGKTSEFLYTIKLFRAFCSWAGNIEDLRLMVPLLNNPFLMSFITRQMSNKKIEWSLSNQNFTLVKNSDTVQVFCENSICRKTSTKEFLRKIPSSMGKISLQNDLDRLYCQDLRKTQYKLVGQEKRIKRWIMQQSLDEENFLVSQFISLLTGVPDLLIRSTHFQDLKESARATVDFEWGKWASLANSSYSSDIFFEESVMVEKIDNKLYFNKKIPKFQVVFEVNLGEIDRIHQGEGKLNVYFNLTFPQKFIKWMRSEWINRDFDRHKKNEKLIEIFKNNILNQVRSAKKKFIIPPWKKDLEKLIVLELLDQLSTYVGPYFDFLTEDTINIPISFNYGPFALKYFHYRFRAHHGFSEIDL